VDNSLTHLPNSLKLEDFFVQFTWKEGCNYKAYLFIVFAMANPHLFPLKLLSAYLVDCLCVSCRNPVCNPVGIPM